MRNVNLVLILSLLVFGCDKGGDDGTSVIAESDTLATSPPYLQQPSEATTYAIHVAEEAAASGDIRIVGGLIAFAAFARTINADYPYVNTFAIKQGDASIGATRSSIGGRVQIQDGLYQGNMLTVVLCGVAPLDLHALRLTHATNRVGLVSLDLVRE